MANVHSLGAKVTFLSVIGDDWEGALLRQALDKLGVSTWASSPNQAGGRLPATMAASQLLVRFDQGSTDAIARETGTD